MKKILYSFMLLFAATLCFTACSDDEDDNGSIAMPANLAQNIAGTYAGTWTSTNQKTGAVLTGEGTVTLTEESAYVATFTVNACQDVNLTDALTSIVNVSWRTNNVYSFFNKTTTNEFGTAFAGKVNAEGNTLSFEFVKSVRAGRVKTDFNFSFNGTKQ